MKTIANLEIVESSIPGLQVVSLPVHGDHRGWFKENWQKSKMTEAGLPAFRPVQNNISFNGQIGTTRGFHAEPWDKFVAVATGRIFGAWVDLRQGPSFGRVFTAELGIDKAVFVPRGVANAFQTLEPNTAYTYLVTEHWSAEAVEKYSYVNLSDPSLGIRWPIKLSQAVVSEADLHHPPLSATKPVATKKLLVLGGGGQLGRAFADLSASDQRIQVLSREELDITDPQALRGINWQDIDYLINAAAFTKVDDAETVLGRETAWMINAEAVSAIAKECQAHGVGLVHVSTDYVFDGGASSYLESSKVSPLGVYGQSKAAGEYGALTVENSYLIRTSWVVGRGANFVTTMKKLALDGISPHVVNDQIGRLSFAEDLARAILHLLDTKAPTGIYNFQNSGPPLSWYDIARRVFELCDEDPKRVNPISTRDYAKDRETYAPRPRRSVLDTSKLASTGFTPKDQLLLLEEYLKRENS